MKKTANKLKQNAKEQRMGCRSSWNFMIELGHRQQLEQNKRNFEKYLVQNFDGTFNFRKPTGEWRRPTFMLNGDFFAKFKL